MNTAQPMDINKVTALAGMVLLFIIYAYLNADKFPDAAHTYYDLLNGRPAPELTLQANGETLAAFRLPSTGFFDAAGQRQLYFQRLDEASYQRLQQQIGQADIYLNGAPVKARRVAKGQFLALLLPRRKIYLVKEHDTKTIAALLWNENHRVRDVLNCQGEDLCNGIRLAWTGGIGPLQGPFLDTDLLPIRRGMPRGRWGIGPESTFIIEAHEPMRVKLSLLALDPSRNQEILLEGDTVTTLHKIKPKTQQLNIAGKRLYPKQYVAEVMLAPGRNEFRIEYGNWARPGRRSGEMAAYLVSLAIGER